MLNDNRRKWVCKYVYQTSTFHNCYTTSVHNELPCFFFLCVTPNNKHNDVYILKRKNGNINLTLVIVSSVSFIFISWILTYINWFDAVRYCFQYQQVCSYKTLLIVFKLHLLYLIYYFFQTYSTYSKTTRFYSLFGNLKFDFKIHFRLFTIH